MKPSAAPDPLPLTRHAEKARLSQDARSVQLIEAAIQVFARKGFQGAKTKEIAELAGINEALLFRDFHSKEKLYAAILEYVSNRRNADQWIRDLSTVAEARDDQALFSGLAQRILAQYQGKRELVKLMLYSALESHDLSRMFRQRQFLPVEMFLADYVRLRQEEGAFVGGDPRCIAQSFIWVCNHQVLLSELFGAELGIPGDDQAVNTFTSLFLNGVRSPRPACDRNHQNEL